MASDAEGVEAVMPFVSDLKVTFPVLLDSRSQVSTAYGARELPSSFLIDRHGRVVAAAKGAREWDSDGAVAYLRERLTG